MTHWTVLRMLWMEQAESDPAPIYRTTPRRKVEASGFWDTAIEGLLRKGNSFLPLCFSDDGYLFRGMRSGIGTALKSGLADHFPDTHSMGSLEAELGIYFVSNALSDARSVAVRHACAESVRGNLTPDEQRLTDRHGQEPVVRAVGCPRSIGAGEWARSRGWRPRTRRSVWHR